MSPLVPGAEERLKSAMESKGDLGKPKEKKKDAKSYYREFVAKLTAKQRELLYDESVRVLGQKEEEEEEEEEDSEDERY